MPGGESGYIATDPGYAPYTHCIWWLETDEGYRLSMTVTYEGDTNDGRCGDYIIVSVGLYIVLPVRS